MPPSPRPSSSSANSETEERRRQSQAEQERDTNVGKILYLAAGAALMWLGTSLYDALNPPEEQRQPERPYRRQARSRTRDPEDDVETNSAADSRQTRTTQRTDSTAPVDGAIPSFFCPITHEIMQDPVSTPYGHCYERSAITKYVLIKVMLFNPFFPVFPLFWHCIMNRFQVLCRFSYLFLGIYNCIYE